MFFRLVADSFGRRPRHKLLTGAALALGMGVATAALSVALDVGDRLAKEFRSLGANLVVTPKADSLPLEIGGVDYRPVNAGAYLPEADLPKLKTIFWHNNIVGFAPILETTANLTTKPEELKSSSEGTSAELIGTWASYPVSLSDGGTFITGIDKTDPWFQIQGRWFSRDAGGQRQVKLPLPPGAGAGHTFLNNPDECVVGVSLAKRLGLGQGDRVYVNVPNPEKMQTYLPCVVTGILSTGGAEDEAVLMPLARVQQLSGRLGQYRKLYVSALTKPEDAFAKRDPNTFTPAEYDRWFCTPYISSIRFQIEQQLPGTDVRVIRRVAEGEGQILTHVQTLLWLVTLAAMLAAALAVGASSAASVIERQVEIGLMKALGAGPGTVGFLLAAEQLLLAFVGGGVGYALGMVLARLLGEKIFGAAPEPTLLVFFVVIGLAAVVTLLGSALPLRRASRIDPAPILRGE
jgi:putative ABC transport system permease protein